MNVTRCVNYQEAQTMWHQLMTDCKECRPGGWYKCRASKDRHWVARDCYKAETIDIVKRLANQGWENPFEAVDGYWPIWALFWLNLEHPEYFPSSHTQEAS